MSRKNKPFEIIPLDPNNEVDAITLNSIKTYPRIEFEAYKELERTGQLELFAKLRHKKKIFFDEETGMFCFYCPYHRVLRKCAKWKDDLEE